MGRLGPMGGRARGGELVPCGQALRLSSMCFFCGGLEGAGRRGGWRGKEGQHVEFPGKGAEGWPSGSGLSLPDLPYQEERPTLWLGDAVLAGTQESCSLYRVPQRPHIHRGPS